MNEKEEKFTESGEKFQILQPNRDLESNWAVDVAKNLEDYLLKICSGVISGKDDEGIPSVNFSEAALLLQGSIQVYSRKVEYLYSLVLHALDFIAQKSKQDQQEKVSILTGEDYSNPSIENENEIFLGLDAISVDCKNSLDIGSCRDEVTNNFVKAPTNLVVLEGDCLDNVGDSGELDSYLLATCDLYHDFLLLDPCDAEEVHNFVKGGHLGNKSTVLHRDSSTRTKIHRSCFQSPTTRSGGTGNKSNLSENSDINTNPNDGNHRPFLLNDVICPEAQIGNSFSQNSLNDAHEEDGDSSDDEIDPWKPLNPHECGDLKVKPFKRIKRFQRRLKPCTSHKLMSIEFPLAKLDGTVNPEFSKIWEAQNHCHKPSNECESPPLYEKLRASLVFGENKYGIHFDDFNHIEDENECGNDSDFDQGDHDLPNGVYTETEISPQNDEGMNNFDNAFGIEFPDTQQSLEDLCRSHLDSLLASIAETEKQTELATRVSTWKQRIDHSLEEQDSHPPFDIHVYAERVLGQLSEEHCSGSMSFANIVKGQQKHDIARTFSALLHLVNNRDVDLDKGKSPGQSTCFTADNPFYVRLLEHEEKGHKESKISSSKKRIISPTKGHRKGLKHRLFGEKHSKACSSSELNPTVKLSKLSPSEAKFALKVERNKNKCTESKRRRRSKSIDPVGLHSAR